MSSMRSASSRTITSTMSRCTSPRWLKSSRRPGVATRMSQKRASSCLSCLSKSMPPTKVITFSPVYLVSAAASLAICTTSSRVGAMISARSLVALFRRRGLQQLGDDRDEERGGLAGAGLGAADGVLAAQGEAQYLRLDRGAVGKPRSWMACIRLGARLKSWKRVLPSCGSTTKSSSFQLSTGFGLRSRRGLSLRGRRPGLLCRRVWRAFRLSRPFQRRAGRRTRCRRAGARFAWAFLGRLFAGGAVPFAVAPAGPCGTGEEPLCGWVPSALPKIFLSALSTAIS